MKWIGLFLVFQFLPVNAAKHPVHFSVINLELDETTMQLDYTIRILQEDYVYLLSLIYDTQFHQNNGIELVTFDSTLISKYFDSAFKISEHNRNFKSEFVGQKTDVYDVWISFSIKLEILPENLTINNQIMLDVFLDQTNLVIFSYLNKEKGLTFDAQNTKQLITIKNIL
jgi:hypothetical protein